MTSNINYHGLSSYLYDYLPDIPMSERKTEVRTARLTSAQLEWVERGQDAYGEDIPEYEVKASRVSGRSLDLWEILSRMMEWHDEDIEDNKYNDIEDDTARAFAVRQGRKSLDMTINKLAKALGIHVQSYEERTKKHEDHRSWVALQADKQRLARGH